MGGGVEQDRLGSLASSSSTDVSVDLSVRVCASGQQQTHTQTHRSGVESHRGVHQHTHSQMNGMGVEWVMAASPAH